MYCIHLQDFRGVDFYIHFQSYATTVNALVTFGTTEASERTIEDYLEAGVIRLTPFAEPANPEPIPLGFSLSHYLTWHQKDQ